MPVMTLAPEKLCESLRIINKLMIIYLNNFKIYLIATYCNYLSLVFKIFVTENIPIQGNTLTSLAFSHIILS
jgi:hypothetical protein